MCVLSIAIVNGSTGVSFIPSNNFYSTYSMWALSLTVDLEPHYSQLHHINDTLTQLKQQVIQELDNKKTKLLQTNTHVRTESEPGSNPIFYSTRTLNRTVKVGLSSELMSTKRSLVSKIDTFKLSTDFTLVQLEGMLDNVKAIYTQDSQSRQKRSSLLPWGGDLLKSLFGTATDSDLVGLKKQLSNLAVNQNALVHVVENSLSIVNKTNTIAVENRHLTNTLVADLEYLSNKFETLRITALNYRRLTNIRNHLTSQVDIIIRSVAQTLENSQLTINRLTTDLNIALRGELSTNLLKHNELRKILTEISERIPQSLTVKDYEGNQVMWYYKHLPVTIIPDSSRIHIITVIPLIPVESLFTLYRVVSLPLPVPNSNQSSELILEGTHFAVSNRGTTYVILDEDELMKCSKSDMSYCPLHRAAMNIARMPSCLSNLYAKDYMKIKRDCPVKVSDSKQFPMFRHLTKGKWMVATRERMTIHPRCDTNADVINPVTVEPPVQIIELKSSCTGYSEFATLPPYFYKASADDDVHSYGHLNIGLSMTHISELNASDYNFDFQLSNPLPLQSKALSEVDPIDITFLKSKLDKISGNKVIVWSSDGFYTIMGSVGALAVIFVIITIIYIIYRYRKKSNNNSVNIRKNVKVNYNNDVASVDQGRVSFACVGNAASLDGDPSLARVDATYPGLGNQAE